MKKQALVLAVIATLTIGLGAWLSQRPSNDKFEAVLMFDDLKKFANQVNSVEIKNAQGVLYSIKKTDERWLANFELERPAYPISQTKLTDFIKSMISIKLVEAKTSKQQNYARLGLQPIDIDDSMASLVTLKTDEKSWQVLVGSKVSLGGGQYVLKTGDVQSWKTDKTITLPIDKFSWLKKPILPYQSHDIRSVSRVDSQDWHIVRSVSGNFELINMPKDEELVYASILNSIVGSLTSLDFEQLFAADEFFLKPIKVLTQLEVSTEDKNVFQVVVSELDDKHLVSFSSESNSEYWQQWYYQISNFSAKQLVRTSNDFLAKENTILSNINKTNKNIEEGESPY
jgi:hypothetical protein